MSEIVDLVDRICADHRDHPSAIWPTVVETGLHRVGVPAAVGGSGGTLTDAAEAVRALAANGVGAPLAEQTLLAGWLAEVSGLVLPDGLIAVAWGPDLRLANNRVTGRARRVAWGAQADHVLVLASTVDGGFGVALLPRPSTHTAGANLAGEPRDDLVFGDPDPSDTDGDEQGTVVAVPEWVLDALVLRAAFARSLQISGALDRTLELTLRHTRERHQFGRPLCRMDVVRHQAALLAGEVALTAAAVDAALVALSRASSSTTGYEAAVLPVAAAKVQAGMSATAGARIAHQLHGTIGFTFEHGLRHLTTRLWSWRDEYGNDEYWARRVFAAVHANGPEQMWAALTSR